MVDDESRQTDKDMWMLKEILSAITNQPMLKIIPEKCPKIEQLTDEVELYRTYNAMAPVSETIYCTLCDLKFKNADSAVVHYFDVHQFQFDGELSFDLTEKNLVCNMCGYRTYAKNNLIGHLGHFHNKFKDSYETIQSHIEGLPPYNDLFTNSNQINQLMNRPVPAQNIPSQNNTTPKTSNTLVFMFSITGSKVNFNCVTCKMTSLSYNKMKHHLTQAHQNKPFVLKCQDCESCEFHQTLLEEYKLLQHFCSSSTSNNLEPLAVTSTRKSLTITRSPAKQTSNDNDAELIEID